MKGKHNKRDDGKSRDKMIQTSLLASRIHEQSNCPSKSAKTSTSSSSSEVFLYDSIAHFTSHYIDELGFYRFTPENEISRQSTATPPQPISTTTASINKGRRANTDEDAIGSINRRLQQSGDSQLVAKRVRAKIGISHFDKLENYEAWKHDWDTFIKNKLINNRPVTITRGFIDRVRAGIPHDYRPKVWGALIRMRTDATRKKYGEDIYQRIVSMSIYDRALIGDLSGAHQDDEDSHLNHALDSNYDVNLSTRTNNDSYDSALSIESSSISNRSSASKTSNSNEKFIAECIRQIDLDLLRTLPNNCHFQSLNSIGIQRVRRVLAAYAIFNPSIGYCQGMNRLAAVSLLVLPETEAFFALIAIVNCTMPPNYYLRPWLAQVDCCVLTELLQKAMPKLHSHLKNNDIQLTLFSWFFTIFVDGFRPELILRIWDTFLLEGDTVLFRYALAVLFVNEADLMQIFDFATMSSHLRKSVSLCSLDIEHLSTIAFKNMSFFSHKDISERREYHKRHLRATFGSS